MWYSMLALAVLSTACAPPASAQADPNSKAESVVVILDRSRSGGLSILVESKPTPSETLIDEFNRVLGARGTEVPILVLAKRDVTLGDLQNIRAILGKIGVGQVRFFSFDQERNLMSEVTIEMLGIPFTRQPPPRVEEQQ